MIILDILLNSKRGIIGNTPKNRQSRQIIWTEYYNSNDDSCNFSLTHS